MAVFGAIVLMAIAGVDYSAAASARPEGRPLSVTEHVLTRFAQAKVALGLAPPSTTPTTSVGEAMAAIQAALQKASGGSDPTAPLPTDLAAAVASGDQEAVAEAVQSEFGKVSAALEGAAPEPAPRKKRDAKRRTITVGIGTCAKRSAGKFCSVGD